jgi:uncharacterized protein (TIGR02147 family)
MKPNYTPDLYRYDDFRRFLSDCYTLKKKNDPTYSYKRFAEAADLGSHNYLKLVMDGDRALTIANIHRFSSALDLTPSETRYFEALVLFNQAESNSEKAYYRARLSELTAQKSPSTIRKSSSTALLDSPVTMAVIVCLHGLHEDDGFAAVASRSGAKKETVAVIVETLLREKLVSIVDHRYELTDRYIQFQDRQSRSSNQKRYLKSQLEESMRALDSRYAKDAKFYCNTFTIAKDSLEVLQDRIANWIDDLMNDTNAEPAEQVVQLNIQLFPHRQN